MEKRWTESETGTDSRETETTQRDAPFGKGRCWGIGFPSQPWRRISGFCPTRSLHGWLRRSGASRRSGGGATLLGCPPGLSLSLRHRVSTPVRRAACCAGGFVCVALVESVLRPGGWEKKCRLTCHCVRHISPDNKHGQPVKARHSLPSRWRAGTELRASRPT